jgi:hypothetical protein
VPKMVMNPWRDQLTPIGIGHIHDDGNITHGFGAFRNGGRLP